MAERVVIVCSENIFLKLLALSSCFHGCTNVHSIHDRTPLFHSPRPSKPWRSGAHTISGPVWLGRGLVIGHRCKRVQAVGQHLPSSKRHPGLSAACRLQGVDVSPAAFASVARLHCDLSCYFLREAMSNDTKNAGIGYLLSILIVIAAASLPSIVL